MSGFSGPNLADLGRIVDALQQMIRLQGATYEVLAGGIAVVTVFPLFTNAVNDAAAAAAGVQVGGLYRNGSIVMQRVV